MNIFYLLIGVSLVAALIFLALLIWAVKSGQYEDNYTPSIRVLFDDNDEEFQPDNGGEKEPNKIAANGDPEI